MVEGPGIRLYALRRHAVAADATTQDAPGELPEAPPGTRRTAVVFDRRPRGVHHLAGYARAGDRHSNPFLAGPFRDARLLAVAPPVCRRLGYLAGAHPKAVVPRDAVELLAVQARRYVGGDQLLYLLKGVGPVSVVQDRQPEVRPIPTLTASRCGYPLALKHSVHGVHAVALDTDHAEDSSHDPHLFLVHQQAVAGGVELEAVLEAAPGHDLALAGALQLAPAAALRDLGPLVFA